MTEKKTGAGAEEQGNRAIMVKKDMQKTPAPLMPDPSDSKRQKPHRVDILKIFGLILIPVIVIIMAILVRLNMAAVFEPPYVLPILNTLFLGIIPILIAFIVLRVVIKSNSSSVFLLGCGLLIFGLGSIVAGWVNSLPGGPNMTVTIHNTCACIGSIFIFAGAITSLRFPVFRKGFVTTEKLLAMYAGIVIFVVIFSFATIKGIIPPFFIPGSGPTVLRQVILENAVIFFAISSLLFMFTYLKRMTDFFFWLSVSLALIATGLLAVFFQPSVGSLIGWIGRTAQYLGCVFALYAVLTARRAATVKGIPLDDIIANFFVDAEQSYTQLVETATDAIITLDQDFRVLLWNPAAERMFGYLRDEAIGLPFPELAIDDHSVAVIKNVAEDITNDQIRVPKSIEIIGKHKDKTLFPIELTISLRMQEGMLIRTFIIRDLTERKKVEEALKESERKYRNLYTYAQVGLFETSLRHGTVIACNERYATLAGFSSVEDAIGKDIIHIYANPDDRKEVARILHEQGHIDDYIVLFRNHRTGRPFWAQFSARINSEKDTAEGSINDITDRKRTEEVLAATNRKLNLLSGITRHDINNQILTLNGFLAFLHRKVSDPSLEVLFKRITTASDRISAMIRFTKEYENIGINVPIWQDCRTLVDTATTQVSVEKVVVKNDLAAGTEVFADPLVIKVMFNLIDNAVFHGEKITTIRFFAVESGDTLNIVCEDDGIGIPPEDKKNIFERGFGKNTGMGLFLSKEILDITGITLRETGELGHGARFEMVIPKGAWRTKGLVS